jgi:DNA-binding transcriptional MerR regulator
MTGASHRDPLQVLREYRGLAPWNLRDLSAVVGGVLEASAVTPINAAARATPSERTIRFYVARGLVSPPEGRGTAATYSYRHFLQLLCIKLRQMEGATLSAITKEMKDSTGDVLERRAAQSLGPSVPTPERLSLRAAPARVHDDMAPHPRGARPRAARRRQSSAGAPRAR